MIERSKFIVLCGPTCQEQFGAQWSDHLCLLRIFCVLRDCARINTKQMKFGLVMFGFWKNVGM